MNRLLIMVVVVMLSTAASSAHAGTILDLLKPHVGQNVLLTSSGGMSSIKLASVGDDYFCVDPELGADQCFPARVIMAVILRTNDKENPVGVEIETNPQNRLPGTPL